MFRVAITGDADFSEYLHMFRILDNLLENISDEIQIITGTNQGVDRGATKYAEVNHYPVICRPVDNDMYGDQAYYERSKLMANESDALVVFWNGKTTWPNELAGLAKARNIPVRGRIYKGK